MSGTLICGRHTASDTIVPVEVNADGTLEMTAEIDSSALAKESTLDSFRTENASNLGTIAATLDDGTQQAKIMGSETGLVGGTQKQVRVDGNGRLSIDINSGIPTKTDGTAGHSPATGIGLIGFDSGTANAVKVDSSGVQYVKEVGSVNVLPANTLNSGITNDPADSVAVGLRGRTTITDSTTETFCLVDAAGHLQVDVLSGGGGGGSTTYTIETKSVPDNTMTIIGDGTNAYIDTNGGSKFVVSVLSGTFTGSPAISIEWSDNSSFSANKVFICNGFIGGAAVIAPASLQSTTRLDGTTLAIQGVITFDNIPARYARITIEQTSGGAIVYVANTTLSP